MGAIGHRLGCAGRDDGSRAGGSRSAGLGWPWPALPGALAALAVVATLFYAEPGWRAALWVFVPAAIAAAAGLTVFLERRIRRELLQPLAQLRVWAGRMRAGQLAARIPEPPRGAVRDLVHELNGLGEMVSDLSAQMEARVQKATRRIAQKSRSLEILCDVAATINTSRDLDQLLKKFIEIVSEVVEARGALVRLLTADGRLRLVASEGIDEEIAGRERLITTDACACGRAFSQRTLQSHGLEVCREHLGRSLFACDENMEMVAVPLTYRGRVLGIYNLFLDRPLPLPREDLNDLLKNIGRHLGIAIEKVRLDEESKRLSVMEERTLLAHELHDSLAQTLSSLRFQVRTLDETLQAGDRPAVGHCLNRITNSLDEANRELREVLVQFRAPVDHGGLVTAVEKVVEGFAHDSGVDIYLQQEWHRAPLPAHVEMQILRVVQESLANVRKHGRAHHVRVILRDDEERNTAWVLIEDDGVGFKQSDIEERPGEHLGLSIMQDRARRLGGMLKVESEAGEGTRVTLSFPLTGGIRAPIGATG